MRTAPILVAFALFVPVGNALADIVASQSGSDATSPWSLSTTQALAVSWTSPQTYSNVTVDVTLDGLLGNGGTVQAYLMDKIGSGATSSDVLDTNSFTYPLSVSPDETLTAFSGLTLIPGTYYLVLYDPTSGGWWGSNSVSVQGLEVQTTGPGVTISTDEFASSPNSANPYESSFSPFDTGLHFSVTGDLETTSAVPEPSSVLMLAGILACGILLRIKKARTS